MPRRRMAKGRRLSKLLHRYGPTADADTSTNTRHHLRRRNHEIVRLACLVLGAIDLVGAYRQLTKAHSDIHKQVFLWFNEKSGDVKFCVDLGCYFGDRIMVHKLSRIYNFVVFCVLPEISKRDDHIRPQERNLKEWLQDREATLGADQAALTFAEMYIDGLSGISVGQGDSSVLFFCCLHGDRRLERPKRLPG